jgi:type IV pilus assembly protein PilB
MPKLKFGELLLKAGAINEAQLKAALNEQKRWGKRLGTTMVEMGILTEQVLRRALSKQLNLPSVDFSKVENIDTSLLEKISQELAEKYHMIPLALRSERGRETLHLAMADPTNVEAVSEIEFSTGYTVKVYISSVSAIDRAIRRFYMGQHFDNLEPEMERGVSGQDDDEEQMVLVRGVMEQTMEADGRSQATSYDKVDSSAETTGVRLSPEIQALVAVLVRKGLFSAEEYFTELEKIR